MSAHEFTIPVSELDAAGKQYHFPIRAEWLRGALEDTEAKAAGTDGALDVRVSKSGNDVVVHGTLKASLQVPCARCLEPFVLTFDQPLSALMVPASTLREEAAASGDEDVEVSGDDPDVVPYSGDTVVLDDIVRDELLLEIPMIPLCSEDCPGISPPPAASGAGTSAEGAGGADPRGPAAALNGPGADSRPLDPRLAPLLRFKKIHEKKE